MPNATPRSATDGIPTPVPPRPAATVVLVRDRPHGMEVLLLRKREDSPFAAGAWVFPGGAVDEADRAVPLERHAAMDLSDRARRLRSRVGEVAGWHAAAVRETFEEAGILLARRVRTDHELAAGAELVGGRIAQRQGLVSGSATAADFHAWLWSSGLAPDTGSLTPFRRWLTPRREPRRFDTLFLLATAPDEQVAVSDEVETTAHRWMTPAGALAAAERGELPLIHPTIRTLHALADCESTGQAHGLATAGELRPHLPHVARDAGGRPTIIDPGEDGYPEGLLATELPEWGTGTPDRDAGRTTGPTRGGCVEARAELDPLTTRVLAPNPSPMTLDGTNTYLLGAPGSGEVVCVDPGPEDAEHRRAVEQAAGDRDAEIVAVIVTHHHRDHAEAAGWAEAWGVPLRAFDPPKVASAAAAAERAEPRSLSDGEAVHAAGVTVEAVHTPGHASDHLCLRVVDTGAVLTGDHVLGRGSSVVAWPDGDLAAYLESLERLRRLDATALYPGHGPSRDRPGDVVDAYLAHRREREQQVLAALERGARSARDVVEVVYADVDPALHPAAALTVRAHLEKLVAEDRIVRDPGGCGDDEEAFGVRPARRR
ncbi:MBL fold metallo-hydrolase [Egibacter rhizosphaerae]|uniref:MBL fold metallo-hydrolase n=1 Tax=Egibacter rhizosphaerae TaxID=1670831 RepID=A0A411YE15_9ACTN|nr:MBL fold metallo-hydrolase [Egibacter rhizosphaerae]QBI19441.1 MBL fold metallo-hydrolase [Egibacter rhizosphaerae]